MWPVVYAFLRTNARLIVFPAAVVIGVIGYNLENLLSSKYTPYSQSIEQQRIDRLTQDEELTKVKKATYENVLEKNLSESLRKKNA
ncbi:hypothetical protein PVAND_007482 [Polypedilum vanderplanki]|uniref:Small integral membrane protein 12 n=1 Tax=Polypedilum vanderplanki TaxID=319348 RepID=A0A9J6C719_POLVA|nr:hypothetical protein PVAND_007482 [Polypedilum vanderplanki]